MVQDIQHDQLPTSTVSRTFTIPGCRRVRNFRRAFFAKGRRDRFALISKENMLHLELSSCQDLVTLLYPAIAQVYTLLVPLCNVHIDWSMSTRFPKVYGKAGPFDIDATADLKKSMPGHPSQTGRDSSKCNKRSRSVVLQGAKSVFVAMVKWDIFSWPKLSVPAGTLQILLSTEATNSAQTPSLPVYLQQH